LAFLFLTADFLTITLGVFLGFLFVIFFTASFFGSGFLATGALLSTFISLSLA